MAALRFFFPFLLPVVLALVKCCGVSSLALYPEEICFLRPSSVRTRVDTIGGLQEDCKKEDARGAKWSILGYCWHVTFRLTIFLCMQELNGNVMPRVAVIAAFCK